MFHIIDDARVILRSRGVYRQVDLYQRNGHVYAKYGSGFIRMMAGGRTSVPSLSWDELLWDGYQPVYVTHGYMSYKGVSS